MEPKTFTFTNDEVALMINMLNDLRKIGKMTADTWATSQSKALYYKIQPVAEVGEYYLRLTS